MNDLNRPKTLYVWLHYTSGDINRLTSGYIIRVVNTLYGSRNGCCIAANVIALLFAAWPKIVKTKTESWKAFHTYWLGEYPGEKIVVHYENLKQDIGVQARRMAQFLRVSVTDEVINCTVESSVGSHRRLHTKNEDALNKFTHEMLHNINEAVVYLKKITDEEFPDVYTKLLKQNYNRSRLFNTEK